MVLAWLIFSPSQIQDLTKSISEAVAGPRQVNDPGRTHRQVNGAGRACPRLVIVDRESFR